MVVAAPRALNRPSVPSPAELSTVLALVEEADVEPTTQAMAAVRNAQRDFASLVSRWSRLRTTELAALNAKLRAAGQATIGLEP